jgi:hypothetical protein
MVGTSVHNRDVYLWDQIKKIHVTINTGRVVLT